MIVLFTNEMKGLRLAGHKALMSCQTRSEETCGRSKRRWEVSSKMDRKETACEGVDLDLTGSEQGLVNKSIS
jgi:hypothetical protein